MAVITETTDAPGRPRDGDRPDGTPYRMAPGDRFEGTFESFDDSDWIEVEMLAGIGYYFILDPAENAGTTGADLRIYDPNFPERDAETYQHTETVEPVRQVFSVNPVEISGQFREEGTWFVAAEAFGAFEDGATGRYTLSMFAEVGNDFFTESVAAIGRPFTSRLDYAAYDRMFSGSPGDMDSVAADLEAGTAYTFTLTGPDMLFVIGERGSPTEFGGDSTAGDGVARVVFTPEESGRYFAEIEGVDGATVADYTLLVSAAGELIEGGDTGERLTGTPGDDTILGNGGNDVLIGAGGGDGMTGGAGADTFVFRPGEATVTVSDFDKRAGDRLALDDRFFGLGGPGIDPRPVSQAQARAALDAGKVIYDRDSGELWIDADGAGRGAAPALVAVLEGGPGFTFEDVLLF